MRRILLSCLLLTFTVAIPAAAQKKPKDEVLYRDMMQEFAKMMAALGQLNARLQSLETEMARVKQQAAELGNEMRNVQAAVRESGGKVSELHLSSERSLLTLNRDLVQVRSDLSNLIDLVKRQQTAMVSPANSSAPAGPSVEGYIMEVAEREVKISLGTGQGSRPGMRLGVYAAADPKTQIGQLVVIEVLDANNSKAEIILQSPGARFQFSDIVRPIT